MRLLGQNHVRFYAFAGSAYLVTSMGALVCSRRRPGISSGGSVELPLGVGQACVRNHEGALRSDSDTVNARLKVTLLTRSWHGVGLLSGLVCSGKFQLHLRPPCWRVRCDCVAIG